MRFKTATNTVHVRTDTNDRLGATVGVHAAHTTVQGGLELLAHIAINLQLLVRHAPFPADVWNYHVLDQFAL
jgi:hypothetical protein